MPRIARSGAGPFAAEAAQSSPIQCSRPAGGVPLVIPAVNALQMRLIDTPLAHSIKRICRSPIQLLRYRTSSRRPSTSRIYFRWSRPLPCRRSSGAGYPGVPSASTFSARRPTRHTEEVKHEEGDAKNFRNMNGSAIDPFPVEMSAQCNRWPLKMAHGSHCIRLKKDGASDTRLLQHV